MNESLPPSAATSARMVLASLALSPFLFKLSPKLIGSASLCGCFTALGYITQSLALVDVSPATVAFLGAATVSSFYIIILDRVAAKTVRIHLVSSVSIESSCNTFYTPAQNIYKVLVCPTLEALVDKKPMGVKDEPQKWLAAFLCISGVGILELYDPTGSGVLEVGFGDVLALLQAVGFGTSFFLTERMMRGQPDQALPITAMQVSMTSLICVIWCLADGWIGQPGSGAYSLPNLFFEPTVMMAAGAIAWTGLVTTALNRVVETLSLGKVSSAEASVILATEPLWAALFAALLLSENFGANDFAGGGLIVLACLANTLKPTDFSRFWAESD